MWPVSDRYLETWVRSHTQHVYLEILHDGDVDAVLKAGSVTDPATGAQASAVAGSISVSNTAIRRSCSIQLTDPAGQLTPLKTDDFLAPFRTEVRIWIGLQYWDVTDDQAAGLPWQNITSIDDVNECIELIPVGTFVLTNPQVSERVITFTGYDRVWFLDNFPAPYTLTSKSFNLTVSEALVTLLTKFVPAKRFDNDFPDLDTEFMVRAPLAFDADTSVFDAAQRVARLAGWNLYVDPMGVFRVQEPPSTDDEPTLFISDGPYSALLDYGRDIGSGDVKNAVVYTSEGTTQTPARGYAQDDNDDSFTNVLRVGTRPMFLSDPAIITTDQANMAARAQLLTILGLADQHTISIIPLHALDVDDVISLTNSVQNMIGQKIIVDNFNIPLRASDGVMTVQCRANVVVG